MENLRAWRDRVNGKVFVWAPDGFDVVRTPNGIWQRETVRPEGLAGARFACLDAEDAEAFYVDARLALASAAKLDSPPPTTSSKFRVLVDDNFDYMDADERTEVGAFETMEEAIAKAKEIVESSLRHLCRPGMTAETLWDYYTSFGDDPFISPGGSVERFSAWDYAKHIIPQIIAEAGRQPRDGEPSHSD